MTGEAPLEEPVQAKTWPSVFPQPRRWRSEGGQAAPGGPPLAGGTGPCTCLGEAEAGASQALTGGRPRGRGKVLGKGQDVASLNTQGRQAIRDLRQSGVTTEPKCSQWRIKGKKGQN